MRGVSLVLAGDGETFASNDGILLEYVSPGDDPVVLVVTGVDNVDDGTMGSLPDFPPKENKDDLTPASSTLPR